MTLTRLIGDIHGNSYGWIKRVTDFDGPSIQIGDFGVGFGNSAWHSGVNKAMVSHPARFIRGNHDKPEVCKTQMSGYIPDGTVENDVMFIGGAWSIDNPNAGPGWYRRTEGLDWWADEECSDDEFAIMIDTYAMVKPRVMITHDCPIQASTEMFFNSGMLQGAQHPTRTATALQKMFEIHQPDEWYFGHWHVSMDYKLGRTMFSCIGILDYKDVEL